MRQIGQFQFPDQGNVEEGAAWEPAVRFRALNRDVVAAAQTRIEGKWNAYIASVPGLNHENEYQEVLLGGSKLEAAVALAMFPEFEGIPYAR